MVTMYFNDLNFRNIIGVSATGHWLTEKDKKKKLTITRNYINMDYYT